MQWINLKMTSLFLQTKIFIISREKENRNCHMGNYMTILLNVNSYLQ